MSTIHFRAAKTDDVPAIQQIYDYYVHTSSCTFDYITPTVEEMKELMQRIFPTYPYFVCTMDEKVVGYAYAHPISNRLAYQWSTELSIYVAPNYRGKGLGKELYQILFNVLTAQHVQAVYACITNPNPVSERMHSDLGFKLVARWPKAGFKLGSWHDVIWMQKNLSDFSVPAPALVPFSEIAPALYEK